MVCDGTGFVGVEYLSTAAPLITTATQAFNNLVDADYVAAFPGDADQAAVSGAWTSYFNAMATAAQNAITTEASAYQAYINGMAADIQTTMNNIAGEATTLAGSSGRQLWSRSGESGQYGGSSGDAARSESGRSE